MYIFYIIVGLTAALAVVTFCVAQRKKSDKLSAYSFFALVCVVVALVVGMCVFPSTGKLKTSSYRIAYNDGAVITVIDESNGNSKKIEIDDVAHPDAQYNVGDKVTVACNGFGSIVFFTPVAAPTADG